MKTKKNCSMTSCGWGYRHELFGLILLIIASVLTVFTAKALGIVAMFAVGLILYCHKFLGGHCCPCCHSDAHTHGADETCNMGSKPMAKAVKVKKAVVKKVKV